MNSQRDVIYRKRRHALYGERLSVDIANMIYDVSESLVNELHGNVEFDEFNFELMRVLFIQAPVDENEYLKISSEELIEKINEVVQETHKRKTEAIAKEAYPIIKKVYEEQSGTYENIVVPVTDGVKTYQVITNLERASNTEGAELVRSYQKTVTLASIDESWKEHLRELDDLRQSVQNASYEQKDPLLIYKLESFELFKAMIDKINREIVATLMKGHIPIRDTEEVKEARPPQKLDLDKFETSKSDVLQDNMGSRQNQENKQKSQPVRTDKKVGRNDPCPCGSGKKYKHCHGKVHSNVG